MNRTDIINFLIKKIDAKKYLEIGISDGKNFADIKCDYKVSVDPDPNSKATFTGLSDDYFKQNTEKFDVVFVDGLHYDWQVYRDIINSLGALNEGGYIVCHDLNPLEEDHQSVFCNRNKWNGNCWIAFVKLRQTRDDLTMFTVDTDEGCGIICKGSQTTLPNDLELTWENFDKNRVEWLNLISVNQFLKENNQPMLDNLLVEFISSPEDPEINLKLATYYDSIGQTASALSYYLRCAERSDDKLLQYVCLIRGAMCFHKQGTRNFTVKGMLQHAVALQPKRPEAYYLLSRHHENEDKDGHWIDGYMIASIAEQVCDMNSPPLRLEVDYPGAFGLKFQKALTSWWCGLCEESKDIFLDLHKNYELDDEHTTVVINNLKQMNAFEPFPLYNKDMHEKLRYKFTSSDCIGKNSSESYQDMFVLSMLNGKKNGFYLEIGAGDPFYGNNTLLLEKDFQWSGISIDFNEDFANAHNQNRKNKCVLRDATKINYSAFLRGLNAPQNIDYLQLDCDPPEVTYSILLSIPLEEYKFAVITYEHDYYCDETKSFRDKSRQYLSSYGYLRVVSNISPEGQKPYEDWWVHPDLVDKSIIEKMKVEDTDVIKAEDYFLS